MTDALKQAREALSDDEIDSIYSRVVPAGTQAYKAREFARAVIAADRAAIARADAAPVAQQFGIIDPDYARIFTQARIVAWQYGWACLAHGSFTRDLDLLLVPWTDAAQADDVDYFAPRIADAAGLTVSPHAPSVRPHGRKTWTLLLPGFAEPRWVDLSVMTPAAPPAPAAQQEYALCPCKDRPASQCPGEWEPGCDLGANEKDASSRPAQQEPAQALTLPAWMTTKHLASVGDVVATLECAKTGRDQSPTLVAACWIAAHWLTAMRQEPAQADARDAARYRLLRRGQHWSVIDGIGDVLRADTLDTAIDAAQAKPAGGAHG